MKTTLISLGRSLALVSVIVIAAGILARQTGLLDRFFIYFPEKALMESPADVGLEFEDVYLTASDGTMLHGWYVPGQSDTTLGGFMATRAISAIASTTSF